MQLVRHPELGVLNASLNVVSDDAEGTAYAETLRGILAQG